MTNNSTATRESFWSLLSKQNGENFIYIPRIQRDYAQGREDVDTSRIRDKFLSDIFEAVINDKSLDINFIYGNVHSVGNAREELSKRKFIPIDGQQRLTTLFLLHWYFAMYSGALQKLPYVKKCLTHFQYETRHVTGQFCNHLVNDVVIDLKKYHQEHKMITPAIKDYYWFFSDFENDATIKSLIVMLEAIHCKAANYSSDLLDSVFDKLISENSPIHFLYLNIDDIGLTDNIYIKMNARGKPLTHFENFKAQLNAYIKNQHPDFANEFMGNINSRWSQFFWTPEYRKTLKDKSKQLTFDAQMMKFFRFLMLTDYIVNVDDSNLKNSQQSIRHTIQQLIQEQDYAFTSHLFNDEFRHVRHISTEASNVNIQTFVKMNRLLNILSKRKETTGTIRFIDSGEFQKEYIDEERAFIRLIGASEEKTLTNEEQIVLFAEYAFLIKYANDDYSFDKEKELNRWIRIVYNLTKATLNLQLDVLFRMIRTINKIVEDGNAIRCQEYFATILRREYLQNTTPLSCFYKGQVVEEAVKSVLMLQNESWKNLIAEAESSFLDSQISSILDYSGLITQYEESITAYETKNKDALCVDNFSRILPKFSDDSIEYKKVKSYLNKIKMLFDEKGLKSELENKSIFRRALLCFGGAESYMLPPRKPIQSFLDNTDRDCSFKRLLRDNESGKRNIFKQLLDQLDEKIDVVQQLNGIIENVVLDDESRWKKYFIEMPEILDSVIYNYSNKDPMGKYVFEDYKRYICRRSNDNILLLTKTLTSSVNRELYSYVFFLKATNIGLAVYYKADSTEGSEKYAYFTNKHGDEVKVIYKPSTETKEYEFYAVVDEIDEYYGDMDEMLNYVSKAIAR